MDEQKLFQMTSFYSQLTINKKPVSYNVLFHEGRFLFESDTPSTIDAAFFSVVDMDGEWIFNGLKDQSLRNQVKEEIAGFLMTQEFSYT